ncbi:MAG: glutamine synthetase family protein [Prevotellaceae bacterium]|jgi:glutamine synthetase|nr:glutamine synthetase family protein [Prevotellaceae bacterium]
MNITYLPNTNELISCLEKSPAEFTKFDIINFVKTRKIEFVNFMYPGGDHKLKTLNFVINSEDYLNSILTYGERVDGSSLFPYIEAGNSDLYVLPRFRTAFIDPFAARPTLAMLCSFFDRKGNPLETSSEFTLRKADRIFTEKTGMKFQAMVELEYYVTGSYEHSGAFAAPDQKGYHESAPYAHFNEFRKECMAHIARVGGQIKYGHNEVGNFMFDGKLYEQNEIEFLPADIAQTADSMLLAQWIIRNLAAQRGLDITFAPKIATGKAGSGMHVHLRIMKNGVNQFVEDGKLSDTARRAIAGLIKLAPSITAFGNMRPSSYARLVPHQEAPTNVCWGDSNRSVLIRVPLGWTTCKNMLSEINPLEDRTQTNAEFKQTVEIRSPDATADIYLLLAGLSTACAYGLQMPDALEVAQATYVDVNIHREENREKLRMLEKLPTSCHESAEKLNEQRAIYQADGIFTPKLIDNIIHQLNTFKEEKTTYAL